MNLQTLSISAPNLLPRRSKPVSIANSAPGGSCYITKWVPNLHLKLGFNLKKSFSDSRHNNVGSWNVGKRLYGACFSFRNRGGLGRVRCGGGSESEDAYYMRRCVELAKQARSEFSCDPMAGCVIVKDGENVREGFHHPNDGEPHAEVMALREAGELVENATAYVSLEPCNRSGSTRCCSSLSESQRTTPSTEALINAKVKKVVVGMMNPDPRFTSEGINRLREAGIEVVVGVEEDLCRQVKEAVFHRLLSGNCFVTVRYSISINGVLSDQLDEEAVKCGGYYSKLLEEYDVVIYAPPIAAHEFLISASQEPNASQPEYLLTAKSSDTPIRILNVPTEADCKATVFPDKEVALEPKTSQLDIEDYTMVMDDVDLEFILSSYDIFGGHKLLVDLRGNQDEMEAILNEGHEKSLVQKVVVEVLPFWSGGKGGVFPSALASLTQTKRLKNLASRTCGNSVLQEGYL